VLEVRSEELPRDPGVSTADKVGGALQQAATWRALLAAQGTLHGTSADLRARIDAVGGAARPWLGEAPRMPLERAAAGAARAVAGPTMESLLRGHAALQVRIEV